MSWRDMEDLRPPEVALQVRLVDARRRGSCNFCIATTDQVWTVQGVGRTIEVRFCKSCMKALRTLTKEPT